MGIFVILLSINMGFIPFFFQNISTVADRYAYLPSIGFSLIVAYIVHFFIENNRYKKILGIIFIAAVGTYLIIDFQQIAEWKSSSLIIKKTIESNDVSYASLLSLGVSLDSEGKPKEAINYLKRAIQLNAKEVEPYEYLFKAYIHAFQYEEANKLLIYMSKYGLTNTSPYFLIDLSYFYLMVNEIFQAETIIRKLENYLKIERDQSLEQSISKLKYFLNGFKKDKVYKALWFIGNIKLQENKKAEGIELLMEAKKLNPYGRYNDSLQSLLK